MKKIILCMAMLLSLTACNSSKKSEKKEISIDSKYTEKMDYIIRKGETVYVPDYIDEITLTTNDLKEIYDSSFHFSSFRGKNLDNIVVGSSYYDNIKISCTDKFKDDVKINQIVYENDTTEILFPVDITISFSGYDDSDVNLGGYNGLFDFSNAFFGSSDGICNTTNEWGENKLWYVHNSARYYNEKIIINNIRFINDYLNIKNISYCFWAPSDGIQQFYSIVDEVSYDKIQLPFEQSFTKYKSEYLSLQFEMEDTLNNDSFYIGGTLELDLTINGDECKKYINTYYLRHYVEWH